MVRGGGWVGVSGMSEGTLGRKGDLSALAEVVRRDGLWPALRLGTLRSIERALKHMDDRSFDQTLVHPTDEKVASHRLGTTSPNAVRGGVRADPERTFQAPAS